jgi:hypothetical protein
MAEKKLGAERIKDLGQQLEQMAGGGGQRRAA